MSARRSVPFIDARGASPVSRFVARTAAFLCAQPAQRFGGPALVLLFAVWLVAGGVAWPPALVIGQLADPQFVDEEGRALADRQVRVLCYTNAEANEPSADVLVQTDASGRPRQALPARCAFVAALLVRHQQSSGKPNHDPAYTVYATSWPPGTRHLRPAVGTVRIRSDWPLVLFDVVASVEWQPRDNDFAADVRRGLRRASEYLYDLTDGQMAIGAVDIRTNGRAWDSADLRFRAANDARPSAYIGGIVAERTPYTAQPGVGTVFAPAEVLLGRFWDGQDAFDRRRGSWSEESAFRTLVHEWAHYALFLYDEYQQATSAGKVETYCTCRDLPEVGRTPGACGGDSAELAASAMAFHYTATELWLSGRPAVCLLTDQWQVHGITDWDTLDRWGRIQGISEEWLRRPSSLNPGPMRVGLAADLFGRAPTPPEPRPRTTEPTIDLAVNATFSLDESNGLFPQVYVLAPGTVGPDRVLHQGTSVDQRREPSGIGSITLFGIEPASRARVFLDRYAAAGITGGRFVFPPPGGSDPQLRGGQTLRLEPSSWRASLDAAYDMDGPRLTTMTVTLTSLDALPAAPTAQLCTPAADTGCPDDPGWRQLMQPSGPTTWTATFTAPPVTAPPGVELPRFGAIRVQASGVGELIRWFQAAGGVGPGHIDGQAPLRDGHVMVDLLDPAQAVRGERDRVIVTPSGSYDAVVAPLPSGIEGIVGVPLDLDVLMPGATEAADRTLPVPVVLTLFYSQAAIDRLNIQEDSLPPPRPRRLVVLHFSRTRGVWEVVPTAGSSAVLNWLATVPVREDGIYAVGFTGEPSVPPPPTPTPTHTPTPTPTPLRLTPTPLPPTPAVVRSGTMPTPATTPTP